jgi:hypothetical protein
MKKDQLYLIKPNFLDRENQVFFCPGCAQMIGLLEYYPALKQSVEVHLVDFQRPRPALSGLLGEENQSCPVLVLKSEPQNRPAKINVQQANGYFFVEGADEIATCLAHAYSTGLPH